MTDPVNTDALRAVASTLHSKAFHLMNAAADDVDRLRAVIESAPHEPTCAITQTGGLLKGDRYVCTCWKADAL